MINSMPSAKWFKNKADCWVKCSCCGRKIRKGYTLLGVALGEDCYTNICYIFDHEIIEDTPKAKGFGIQKMHFDWVKSR